VRSSPERGQNGRYDPIFLIPELGRTMAELTMEEKNQVSHRAGSEGSETDLTVTL
jgi:inosine/xanthosine triphosphate pyrophosphatase family protein